MKTPACLFPFPTRASRACAAAALGLALAAPARAQAPEPTAQTVTVTGRQERAPGVSGFGDQPLSRSPLSGSVVEAGQLADAGLTSLAGITRFDASVSDAYNAEGYWSSFSVRGYTLDNRYNFRRDGLPINAETALPLGNVAAVEWLRGASGIQAGTSAPGGLVNLVVKRPLAEPLRRGVLEWQPDGTVTAAVDWSQRVGPQGAAGLRVNASASHLDPVVRQAQGRRSLLALAGELVTGPGSRLEVEIESARQSQPSVPGFSLLGNTVPDAGRIDPRVNLNNQAWTQPVVMQGLTGSVRWQQALGQDWQLGVHALRQSLRSDDRTAFPYGVYEPDYTCPAWCDRYGPDGRFSFWQYVSDNERRTSDALDISARGRVHLGGLTHQLQAGLLVTRFQGRFQDQVFDLAGTGRIDGSLQAAPSYGTTDANTDRDERSTEWSLRDVVRLAPAWQLWAGVRHVQLDRSSRRTSPAADGLRATRLQQSATTPWLALAHDVAPGSLVYASWGQGLEAEVAPNRSRYTNAGQPLPALRSRQLEVGWKHAAESGSLALAAFDIDRPLTADFGPCDAASSCTRAVDGSARHRGLEAQGSLRTGAWQWQAGAQLLDAQRRGAQDPAANGTRPVNVPAATLRLGAVHRLGAASFAPGLELGAQLVAEGDRVVLPYDQAVRIPAWHRVDLSARWRTELGATRLTWRAGLDNATDRRAWREAPYQFGHAYLFPLQPRTWRLGVQAEL